MNYWVLLAQLGVGAVGALVFLSAVTDALMRQEAHLADLQRAWDRKQMEMAEEAAIRRQTAQLQETPPHLNGQD